jgi:hypothetical protein
VSITLADSYVFPKLRVEADINAKRNDATKASPGNIGFANAAGNN